MRENIKPAPEDLHPKIGEDIPDWVVERALAACNWTTTTFYTPSYVRANPPAAFAALCKVILASEAPPVDPDLLTARELCAEIAGQTGNTRAGGFYLSGAYDDAIEMTMVFSALKAARKQKDTTK